MTLSDADMNKRSTDFGPTEYGQTRFFMHTKWGTHGLNLFTWTWIRLKGAWKIYRRKLKTPRTMGIRWLWNCVGSPNKSVLRKSQSCGIIPFGYMVIFWTCKCLWLSHLFLECDSYIVINLTPLMANHLWLCKTSDQTQKYFPFTVGSVC